MPIIVNKQGEPVKDLYVIEDGYLVGKTFPDGTVRYFQGGDDAGIEIPAPNGGYYQVWIKPPNKTVRHRFADRKCRK